MSRAATGGRPAAGLARRGGVRALGPFGRANLAEACSSLLMARYRTALALIGIAIGVASVSAMISAGTIVRTEAARQFQELGTDIVTVRLRAHKRGAGRVSVGLADAEGIVALPSIRRAAPYTIASSHIVLGGTETALARVAGATRAFAELGRLDLAEGRFVSRLDGGRYFCTLGADLADRRRPVFLHSRRRPCGCA